MLKNTPASAGDMGWILVQEDSACPRAAGPVCHQGHPTVVLIKGKFDIKQKKGTIKL